jgi:hypothetical protein
MASKLNGSIMERKERNTLNAMNKSNSFVPGHKARLLLPEIYSPNWRKGSLVATIIALFQILENSILRSFCLLSNWLRDKSTGQELQEKSFFR